jgi:hypothetical protein
LQKHPQCGIRNPTFRPTRLLFFPNGAASHVRVDVSAKGDQKIAYFALSHCWGGAEDILTLRRDNISELSNSIPIAGLARTFQDAIKIVASLGGHYLWIDSLCIIQDCEDDWARESAAMGLIYENAVCTISAHSALNSHDGCYATRDPLLFTPCKIAGTPDDSLFVSLDLKPELSTLQSSKLSSRGWTLQETLLSSRILHFARTGIYWTCRQGYATEIDLQGGVFSKAIDARGKCIFGTSASIQSGAKIRTLNGHFMELRGLNEGTPKGSWSSTWFSIVGEYSERSLTKPGDKIAAISAIAQRSAQLIGYSYAAGLWRECFLQNMMWTVDRWEPFDRPKMYRGPTWSWASVNGKIENWCSTSEFSHEDHKVTFLAKVIDITVSTHEADSEQTGRIYSGSCTILGKLASATELLPAALSGKPKRQVNFHWDNQCHGNLYPDTSGCWPALEEIFLIPLHQEALDTPRKQIEQGIVVQVEQTGRAYQRIGIFSFSSHDWHEDFEFTTSRWFNNCGIQEILII